MQERLSQMESRHRTEVRREIWETGAVAALRTVRGGKDEVAVRLPLKLNHYP